MKLSNSTTWIWKGIKVSIILIFIGVLIFTSALFTVLLYIKATGQWQTTFNIGTGDLHFTDYNVHIAEDNALWKETAYLSENFAEETDFEQASTTVEFTKKSSVMLTAPHVKQYPELPRGCEITSLTMLIQYYGIDKDKMDILPDLKRDTTPIQWSKDGGIAFWGHPNDGFVGDITLNSSGFGIYHAALFETLTKYIPNGIDLTGETFEAIEIQLSNGYPVVAWTTTDYKVPSSWVEWDSPSGKVRTTFKEHAVLIVGYDEHHVYVNDPLKNEANYAVPKDQFIKTWEAMGKQALSYMEHK